MEKINKFIDAIVLTPVHKILHGRIWLLIVHFEGHYSEYNQLNL